VEYVMKKELRELKELVYGLVQIPIQVIEED
jgi:hypothetical protein